MQDETIKCRDSVEQSPDDKFKEGREMKSSETESYKWRELLGMVIATFIIVGVIVMILNPSIFKGLSFGKLIYSPKFYMVSFFLLLFVIMGIIKAFSPSSIPKDYIIGLLFLGLFLTIITPSTIKDTHVSSSSSRILNLGESVKLKKGYPLAISKEVFDRATNIIISKDYEAWSRLLSTGLVRISREGEEVYYEGSVGWGMAKVRPKGELTIFYTNIEALKR